MNSIMVTSSLDNYVRCDEEGSYGVVGGNGVGGGNGVCLKIFDNHLDASLFYYGMIAGLAKENLKIEQSSDTFAGYVRTLCGLSERMFLLDIYIVYPNGEKTRPVTYNNKSSAILAQAMYELCFMIKKLEQDHGIICDSMCYFFNTELIALYLHLGHQRAKVNYSRSLLTNEFGNIGVVEKRILDGFNIN